MSTLTKLRSRLSSSSLAKNEAGLSTVEYAIVLVLVVAICIAVFQSFGNKLKNSVNGASQEFGEKVEGTKYN